MQDIFLDRPSWCVLWDLLLYQHAIVDTRSRGDLTIRIYDRKKRGQTVLATSMRLVDLVRQSLEPSVEEEREWVEAPEFVEFIGGKNFELLPGNRLLWMESYSSKGLALAEAVSWCQQLDVDPAYYEAMSRLLATGK